jgi:FkbM family methyltransferase
MASLAQQWGIGRSLLTYYTVPGRLRQLTRFYAQFIQPGDVCFDVGAHVGNRLWAWSRLGALIVAVEPQPHLLDLLRRLYGRSSHIHLLPVALGAQPGQQALYVSRRHPTVSTLSAEWITAVRQDASFANVDWDTAVSVPVVTLDELIARYGRPAFCKIDVEGYEAQVLRGLSQPLPALSFEYLPAALGVAHECLGLLARLGDYEFNWSVGETHRWQSPRWLSAGEMGEQLVKQGKSGDVYGRWRGMKD